MPIATTESSPKKQCTEAAKTVILSNNEQIRDSVSLRIRTLRGASDEAMPGCLEISNPSHLLLSKDHGISVIVLADVSGSMEGNRIARLRQGVLRLGELIRKYDRINTDFTLITFNDVANIVRGPGPVPNDEKLTDICNDMRAGGGTNIGDAIRLALEVAETRQVLGRAVHTVLFTDGGDSFNLRHRISGSDTSGTTAETFITALSATQLHTFHCVAICGDADALLLNLLAKTARRGTFQHIPENGIGALMGSLWGLVLEMVDATVCIQVKVDGVDALAPKEIFLRLCTPPMPCRFCFMIPAGTVNIQAELQLTSQTCGTTKTATVTLPRDINETDAQCAIDAVAMLQGDVDKEIAEYLSQEKYTDAIQANAAAVDAIKKLLLVDDLELQTAVATAIQQLETQAADLTAGLNDDLAMRSAQANAMSRASTARANGVSINPGASRTQSDLQRSLSDGAGCVRFSLVVNKACASIYGVFCSNRLPIKSHPYAMTSSIDAIRQMLDDIEAQHEAEMAELRAEYEDKLTKCKQGVKEWKKEHARLDTRVTELLERIESDAKTIADNEKQIERLQEKLKEKSSWQRRNPLNSLFESSDDERPTRRPRLSERLSPGRPVENDFSDDE